MKNKAGWRAISEAPKDGRDLLLYSKSACYVGWWNGKSWRDDRGRVHVTHWMELPQPPKESV